MTEDHPWIFYFINLNTSQNNNLNIVFLFGTQNRESDSREHIFFSTVHDLHSQP